MAACTAIFYQLKNFKICVAENYLIFLTRAFIASDTLSSCSPLT